MSKSPRILNLTKNCFLKRSQVERGIEACAIAWVEYGKTVRSLSLAESIAARNVQAKDMQAKDRKPIASSELPGIVFKPPIGAQAAYVMERRLAFEANKFATEAVQ